MISYRMREDCKYELVDYYTHEFKWNLLVPFFLNSYIEHTKANVVVFKPGFVWDGPSGPALDTANGMRASLVHDALYAMAKTYNMSSQFRRLADKELYRIAREDGMSWFRASYWYLGVRFGGWLHT